MLFRSTLALAMRSGRRTKDEDATFQNRLWCPGWPLRYVKGATLMALSIKRAGIILRALKPSGMLERLLLERGILRRGLRGRFFHDRLARLDIAITEALRRPRELPYQEWLALYQPVAAPSPPQAGAAAPVCAVLQPAGSSLAALRRCLRALGQQDQPASHIYILSQSPFGRFAALLAARLEAQPVTILKNFDGVADKLGETVLLLKGAPILRRRALGALSAALDAQPAAQAAYGDEDKLLAGQFHQPFFKPDWSPVLGQQHDYIGNAVLFRRDFFLRAVAGTLGAGGLPSWIGDTSLSRDAVLHIPELLHAEPGQRRLSYIDGAAFDAALAQAARRAPALPRVAIIIPTKDRAQLLRNCISSIFENSDYDRTKLSLVIVDNGSTAPEACELLTELETNPAITVLRHPGPFNYAFLCNQGAAATSAQMLVFLNNDTLIRDSDWLAKLAGAVALPSVGIVGCKLLYPDGKTQHAGIVLGIAGLAAHIGAGEPGDAGVYYNLANQSRELSAVTGALFAMTKELFQQTGGYDEKLAVTFNDVALCLAANRLGRQTLYLQSALAYHLESVSRGADDETPEKQLRLFSEARHVLSVWSGLKCDPFYSPNLSLRHLYDLAHPPRHLLRQAQPGTAPRVLMLSSSFAAASGIALVINHLARALQTRGCIVSIGAPRGTDDLPWPTGQRFDASGADAGLQLAARLDVEIVIVHSAPFFDALRYLPTHIAGIAIDFGDMAPELCAEPIRQRLAISDKFTAMQSADRVLAISAAVRAENPVETCGVLALGNTHLPRWDESSAQRRVAARAARGWPGQLVILNVCAFHEASRAAEGVDNYADLRRALELKHPELAAYTRFVLAGPAAPQDLIYTAARGLNAIANPSGETLAALYHAADMYINFSRPAGYNFGIGQALALGLPVLASDIAVHRAAGVAVTNQLDEAVAAIVREFQRPERAELVQAREPRLQDWEQSGAQLWEEINGLRTAKTGGAPSGNEVPAIADSTPRLVPALAPAC